MTVVFIDVMKCREASRNQVNSKELQNEEKRGIHRFTLSKMRTHGGLLNKRSVYIHTHFHRRKSVYILEKKKIGPRSLT